MYKGALSLILSVIVGLMIFGMIGTVKAEDSSNTPGCKSLYWIDNANKNCEQKEFCGMFMYYGLQTFESKEKCLRIAESLRCTTDSDCPQQSGYCPDAENCTKDTTIKCMEGKCKIQKLNLRENKHNKFIPWQKRNESECPDGCKCRGAVVSCKTENGKNMTITSGNSGKTTTIEINKIKVNTTLEFETNTENNKTSIILNLPDGRNITLKILPERAAERAREKLGEMNYTIELKQTTITKGNETRMVYEIVGEKQGRFLGLFKTKGKTITTIDAETGEVIKMKKPWWSFLAGI
jgi:hypothetical protein